MKVELRIVAETSDKHTPSSVAMRFLEYLDQEFNILSIDAKDAPGGHPLLTSLLRLIGNDNGMQLVDKIEWPPESDLLEIVAGRLDHDKVRRPHLYTDGPYGSEFKIMACGAEHDRETLINLWDNFLALPATLRDLDKFLNEAFDGDYVGNFFEKGRKNRLGSKLRR